MAHGRIVRWGTLAVGLGIAAAVASSPAIAAADASTDWLSSLDLAGGALPAPATSAPDLAISFDGYSLVSDGSANAYTTSGDYDLAIAYGANSQAEAVDGVGDTAIASGSGADANAYDGTGDYAFADGTHAYADAGGGIGSNYDSAIDIGNNDVPTTITPNGAYAGAADLDGGGGGTGSYDTAIDIGNNTTNTVEGSSGTSGAFAGAGGLAGLVGDGNHDTAIDVGNNSGQSDNAEAVGGDSNYASDLGNNTGSEQGVFAGNGDANTAVVQGDYTDDYHYTQAGIGDGNYAYALGPQNTEAFADGGNNNVAYVADPFGSTASEATAGNTGNSDLAAVLFTDGSASAHGADYLYDVLTALGHESGAAAATSGGWLGELLALF